MEENMKLTVLVDNNTIIDRYFQGVPGVSYFIECDDRRYLFDTGYSDLFLKNATKMGIKLSVLDGVVISHGHNDHTWGPTPRCLCLSLYRFKFKNKFSPSSKC